MATIKTALGQYQEAAQLLSEVLGIQLKTFGEVHQDTALSLYNLAYVYYLQKDYAKANSLYRRALDIDRRMLGPSHPTTLDTLYNLACSLNLGGDREDALGALQQLARSGYSNLQELESDNDFKSLHNEPRFAEVVGEVRAHSQERVN